MPTSDALLASLPARERILSTAHDLFYRDGIRATGIDRVIAESGVAKVSFYRHFPSKNDLIVAYLSARHENWMSWFADALQRHGADRKGVAALVPALEEWFRDGGYRGCAFINAIAEFGTTLPQVAQICGEHKRQMADAIESLLPAGRRRARMAGALAMAIDGAIVQAQIETPDAALKNLKLLVDTFLNLDA
jgi:AcrR family transcriptional regulator